MPRDDDDHDEEPLLVSVEDIADSRRVEAVAARRLSRMLVELAQVLESKHPDVDLIEPLETDVAACYRIYNAAKLHRKAAWDA